jgi:hypothetical protein
VNFSVGTSIALGLLSVPPESLVVTDVTYETVAGVDTQVEFIRHDPIVAAVDASGARRLEQIFGGSVSQGDIGIYTADELFFLDADNNEERKQSFVTWQGFQYRIVAVDDWSARGGKRQYLASRHVTQGQI